jgi:hypothetical protein
LEAIDKTISSAVKIIPDEFKYSGGQLMKKLAICLLAGIVLMGPAVKFSFAGDDCASHGAATAAGSDSVKATGAHFAVMERPKVQEIYDFHDVMKPVWHVLIPEGNFAAIKELIPQFKEKVEKLQKAVLPTYYQHLEEKFTAKVNDLSAAVAEMETVAQNGNDSLFGVAVENVHTAFELMARTLSPRMPEIDQFHLVLYPLWHEALPKSDYVAIKNAMPALNAKMDTLMSASIPEKYNDIEKPIVEKRLALKKSVDKLTASCNSGKDDEIKNDLTAMHESFRALDEVFE